MKVVILGASGIIGQHMRLCVPAGIEPIWCRQFGDWMHRGSHNVHEEAPDVIVNLAGECNVDAVERAPARYRAINELAPAGMAQWCDLNNAHLIQVSSQAVLDPVNEYGRQKLAAEQSLEQYQNWTIVRATFVLGIRPMPAVGRKTPMEAMLDGSQRKQVANRFFSPLFARDAASILWYFAQQRMKRRTFHLGTPVRTSRYEIGLAAGLPVTQCQHEDFAGLAQRPTDTTYDSSSLHVSTLADGLSQCASDYSGRESLNIEQRAREIALFLGKTEAECHAELSQGFGPLHAKVNEDFRREGVAKSDEQLLEWYRKTEAYIWELSAYHADPGFNYSGMCAGTAEGLKARGLQKVLCLGDGIGDLTLSLCKAGFDGIYHDLDRSRTAQFAAHRFGMYLAAMPKAKLTAGWEPPIVTGLDAVVSLDFFEHVNDVPLWVGAAVDSLRPGGWLMAQNAFGCGSGPEGSIPCHLERNDRFVTDWTPLMQGLGMVQDGTSNWYQKP